jgi:8-oxo-dGTP pyrophosphatase MutT (NUDIX family)
MKLTHSAGGVVVNPAGDVLVVSQRGTSWSLPKGHVEPGENPRDTAAREINEEAGITRLTFIKELGTYQRFLIGRDPTTDDKSELKTLTFYLYMTDETALRPTDPHNPVAKWVSPAKVAGLLTHPRDEAFFQSILAAVLRVSPPN